jgi:S-adenosylmethionine hydrolase
VRKMPRVIRSDYLIVPDAADLERKKKEEIKKAIERIKEQKKLRKKNKSTLKIR